MTIVISVEHICKQYRLGVIGGGTLVGDLSRWWARLRAQPDPLLKIGQEHLLDREGEYIWALRDVSFEVKQGQVLGIVGRNGAGKSTLLKILSRVTVPTSGQVKVKGRIASLLEVGTGFHPELTGRENIYLNGAILGMSRQEIARKFDEIVDFAEIVKFIDTPVKRYSSGMYVRLAFAVAAHLEPEILLVDEVLAVGDVEFQKKCLGKMGDVAQEGRTVLFVSHNMGAITRLCSRALLIDQGSMVQDGSAEQVVSHYLAMNRNENGRVSWKNGIANPNVHEIAITEVALVNAENQIVSFVDTCQSIFLEIRYRITTTLEDARIGFRLTSTDGTPILEAYDIDDAIPSRVRTPGNYAVKCEIPGRILRPGTYLLSIGAGIPSVRNLVLLDGILVLHVNDSGSNTLPPYMQGQRSGFINPQLIKWERREL